MSADTVFLLDVDNTLLDNDGVVEDLRVHLEAEFGRGRSDRYFTLFEALREEVGYADYLGALQRWRAEAEASGGDHDLLAMSNFLVDYPFRSKVFPRAFEAIAALGRIGPTVILSDGDVVFQPRKIERSGLGQAVDGRVLIFIHKEKMLDTVEQLHPARRYVFVDDKPRLCAALKSHFGARVVTVLPRQGHYALDAAARARYPEPDHVIERIGDLADADIAGWLREPALKEQP